MKKFFYKKSFWTMAGVLSASACLMVACPEKKGNNTAVAPSPFCQPGQFCPPGGIFPGGINQNGGYALASAVGSLDYNGSYIALTFSAVGAAVPAGGFGGVSNYSGPVIASGEVNFVSTGVCPGLIPGRFPIVNTLQQGNWTGGSFGGLILQAANGMQIKLINNFLLTEYGSNPPIRIKNPVYVSTLGGPDCIFTSL